MTLRSVIYGKMAMPVYALAVDRMDDAVYNREDFGASKGFDRDSEAGEASRTGCVKFQP